MEFIPLPKRNEEIYKWALIAERIIKENRVLPSDGVLVERTPNGTTLRMANAQRSFVLRGQKEDRDSIWDLETFNVTTRPDTELTGDTNQKFGNIWLEAMVVEGTSDKGDIFLHAEDSIHADADDDIRIRAGSPGISEITGGQCVNILADEDIQIGANDDIYLKPAADGTGNLKIWDGSVWRNGATGTFPDNNGNTIRVQNGIIWSLT